MTILFLGYGFLRALCLLFKSAKKRSVGQGLAANQTQSTKTVTFFALSFSGLPASRTKVQHLLFNCCRSPSRVYIRATQGMDTTLCITQFSNLLPSNFSCRNSKQLNSVQTTFFNIKSKQYQTSSKFTSSKHLDGTSVKITASSFFHNVGSAPICYNCVYFKKKVVSFIQRTLQSLGINFQKSLYT